MFENLKIVLYPDPRLKKNCAPVETFDDSLRELVDRMFELMRELRGVGLAAPQVGTNKRLFVMNHTREAGDDRVYINPVLTEAAGDEEDEEGCLSIPGLTVPVIRSKTLHMAAQDVTGKPFEQVESGYVARVWQHETDHLNGILLTDRMGAVARMMNRRLLRELEEKFTSANPPAKRAR